jgi:hypothetical protein
VDSDDDLYKKKAMYLSEIEAAEFDLEQAVSTYFAEYPGGFDVFCIRISQFSTFLFYFRFWRVH